MSDRFVFYKAMLSLGSCLSLALFGAATWQFKIFWPFFVMAPVLLAIPPPWLPYRYCRYEWMQRYFLVYLPTVFVVGNLVQFFAAPISHAVVGLLGFALLVAWIIGLNRAVADIFQGGKTLPKGSVPWAK